MRIKKRENGSIVLNALPLNARMRGAGAWWSVVRMSSAERRKGSKARIRSQRGASFRRESREATGMGEITGGRVCAQPAVRPMVAQKSRLTMIIVRPDRFG